MNTIIIPTTQNIELEYPVAHLGDRITSGLIDLGVLILYVYLWGVLIDKYNYHSEWKDYLTDTLSIFSFLPAAFYSLWSEWFFNGQTLGKKIMKMRTIRTDGAPATLSGYLLRWMLRLVDVWMSVGIVLMPGIVGMIAISVNKKGQRLGDILAGTSVIKLQLVTTFGDTMFVDTEENHKVVFPEIHNLSDRDVSILKEVFDMGIKSFNPELLEKLANKVKEVSGIKTKMSDKQFLETVLRDYNHVFGKD
ncbi:MAG: RDD family protein [Bacteroidia bacterium]|nr:RDD family protein [Bacteroidia bacterium]